MSRFLLPALVSLLAGCATVPGDEVYAARGNNPDWWLSISGGLVRLSIGREGPHQAGPVETYRFPGAAPVRSGEKSLWTSTSFTGRTIMVEAEFAPRSSCAHFGPEAVRVVVNGRELRGCGGRQILVTGD